MCGGDGAGGAQVGDRGSDGVVVVVVVVVVGIPLPSLTKRACKKLLLVKNEELPNSKLT